MSFRNCPRCDVALVKDAHDDWHCRECGFVPDPSEEPFELHVRTAREITALPEPDESDLLLGPLVVRGARTLILAASGEGKTTFAGQLVHGTVTGWDVLGYQGAGLGPALIIDLEQGLRSIKRALRDVGLHERDDVLYVQVPDGLALDSDEEHRAEIERIIDEHRPVIVVCDPHYKMHRAEVNEERGVVDLMRYLDGLRARYGFALIMPVHPRKDQTGRNGARKLTLDDVAGSGAITRGAELVVGLERLSHGFARLRILKDRDGDLAVGEEVPLLFTRGEGFRRDERAEETQENLEQRVLELGSDGSWRTYKDFAAELGVRQKRTKELLEGLAESEQVEVAIGPAGRSPKARCYRTEPERWEQSGSVTPSAPDPGHGVTEPDSSRTTVRSGSVDGSPMEPGSVDEDEIERLAALYQELSA